MEEEERERFGNFYVLTASHCWREMGTNTNDDDDDTDEGRVHTDF